MRNESLRVGLALLLLVGCREARQPVRVGLVSGLTGQTAAWGEAIRRGAQLAVDDANAHRADKIELVVEDDQGRPEQSAVVVERLLTENVVAIVGCDTSSRTLAASPLCERAGVAMISPTASAPAVTRGKRYTFRVCATDDGEAIAVARLARERLHAKRVAILRDTKNDYSVGMAQTFTLRFGGVVDVFDYAEGDNDFRAQLTSAAALHPDAIFVPGYYGDVAQIAVQARDLGITAPMIGGSGWDSPKLLEIGGPAINGGWFVSGVRSASPRFVQAFRARYHTDPDAANAEAYDAAAILCAAIGSRREDRLRVRDAVATTREFHGASGMITIGPDGNARKPLAVFQIVGGRFVESGTIPPP